MSAAGVATAPAANLAPADPRAAILFVLFIAIYLLTLRGHLGSRDEESLYMTAVMWEKRAEDALHLHWTGPEPGNARTPVFSSYEPGQPLLAIPFYLAGDALARFFPPPEHTYVTRLVMTLFDVVVTAATVAQLYRLGRLVGYGPRAAMLTALAYGLGTLAWPYSRTFFRDPLVALALLSAVLALARWRARPGWDSILTAGAWLLIGTATKIAALVALPVLTAYAFSDPAARAWVRRTVRGTPGAWLAAAALAVLVVIAGAVGAAAKAGELRGYVDRIGLALHGLPALAFAGQAFYGLTLSPGEGVVEFAPPVLGGLAGLALLWRRRRPEAALCAALPALYLVVYSFDNGWHGGASWGPRYLLPVLPLLLLPLGALATALWARRARPAGRAGLGLLGGLLLAGGLVQGAGLVEDPIHYYLDVLRTHPLTLAPGPTYLQEVHFDPALSPIPGHLVLLARDLGSVVARRTNFYPVPYEPVSYWQYFQTLAAPDFAWLDLVAWAHPGGYSAAVNRHDRSVVSDDPAAGLGRAVQARPGTAATLIATPPDQFPSGTYLLQARLHCAPAAGAAPAVRVQAQTQAGVLAVRAVRAGDPGCPAGYAVLSVPVTLAFAQPAWFEVQATGVTTVTLDRVWLTPGPGG